MLNLSDFSRLKGFRFPRAVIGYAVWAYHRFALSLRDVEDLLAARGTKVSHETVRDWMVRFGPQFAANRTATHEPMPSRFGPSTNVSWQLEINPPHRNCGPSKTTCQCLP
jgi:putative transposase